MLIESKRVRAAECDDHAHIRRARRGIQCGFLQPDARIDHLPLGSMMGGHQQQQWFRRWFTGNGVDCLPAPLWPEA